jgi:starvation-inducible DNA-binding protein
MKTRIGITDKNTKKVAEQLSKLLADEVLLYIKTRNAHWNVEGPDFHTMHLFFESQYEEMEQLGDDVAERMRSLGHYAPSTMKEYLALTHLSEKRDEKNASADFLHDLLGDHESIIVFLRENIGPFANEYGDAGTSDFITGLMEKHEKLAWMLRAHLK